MNCLRTGFAAIALSSLALGFIPDASAAQAVMRICISSPRDSHQGVAIDTLASEVEKRSGKRYRIRTFYDGALGAERAAIAAVRSGSLELAWTSTGPLPDFVPEVEILDVPFLFRDYGHARAVLDGPIGQDMLKTFESKGFKALAWGENGFRHMTNNKRPIEAPEDMRGLKMRSMENPVHVQAYKGFGIIPTPMPFSEVPAALRAGTVDGQENPLSVIVANRFDRVQKYLTLTGHVYSPGVFLMNKAVFDKLPEADRKIFLESALVAAQANRDRVDADERSAVAFLRGKGMRVVDKVDKGHYQAVLAPVFADFERQFGKRNLDRIKAVE